MTNPDLKAEIEEIESHLENVKQQRTAKKGRVKSKASATKKESQPGDENDASAEDLSVLETMLADFDAQDAIDTLSTHAREWLGTLNEDLKHTKPSTIITVFGLGVLVGRLTK